MHSFCCGCFRARRYVTSCLEAFMRRHGMALVEALPQRVGNGILSSTSAGRSETTRYPVRLHRYPLVRCPLERGASVNNRFLSLSAPAGRSRSAYVGYPARPSGLCAKLVWMRRVEDAREADKKNTPPRTVPLAHGRRLASYIYRRFQIGASQKEDGEQLMHLGSRASLEPNACCACMLDRMEQWRELGSYGFRQSVRSV